jgi:hypothetical protein
LATTQQELVEATTELAEGAAQFGSVEPLQDAVAAMQAAVPQLQTRDLARGQKSEQAALVALIRARENMRQLLSMSASASPSQCRSFDRQQRQKLRPPEKREKEDEQQLAQLCSQLDELAQQQRRWSEDVKDSSSSGGVELDRQPQDQQQPKSSQQASQSGSSQNLLQQQQAATAQAQQLQQQLRDSQRSSDLAQQLMDEATQSIRESLDQLTEEDLDRAAETAQTAAEQLGDLSEHLAALNAEDFAEQLGFAQRLAQRLADEQESVRGKMAAAARDGKRPDHTEDEGVSPSEQQRAVATGTEMLAELLAQTAAAALEEDRQTREALDQVRTANPPADIARTMDDAADDYESGALLPASLSAEHAADEINELAAGLRIARQQYVQPRLEELMAAEEELADLIAAWEEHSDPNARALAETRAADLERRIAALARRDARLAQALTDMQSSTGNTDRNSNAGRSGDAVYHHDDPTPAENSGWQRSPIVAGGGLRHVAMVLQNRIQEVILASVRMDSDEPIPPEYRELVDRYYRTLSDDLR